MYSYIYIYIHTYVYFNVPISPPTHTNNIFRVGAMTRPDLYTQKRPIHTKETYSHKRDLFTQKRPIHTKETYSHTRVGAIIRRAIIRPIGPTYAHIKKDLHTKKTFSHTKRKTKLTSRSHDKTDWPFLELFTQKRDLFKHTRDLFTHWRGKKNWRVGAITRPFGSSLNYSPKKRSIYTKMKPIHTQKREKKLTSWSHDKTDWSFLVGKKILFWFDEYIDVYMLVSVSVTLKEILFWGLFCVWIGLFLEWIGLLFSMSILMCIY